MRDPGFFYIWFCHPKDLGLTSMQEGMAGSHMTCMALALVAFMGHEEH
jgi:hypothetical protein